MKHANGEDLQSDPLLLMSQVPDNVDQSQRIVLELKVPIDIRTHEFLEKVAKIIDHSLHP